MAETIKKEIVIKTSKGRRKIAAGIYGELAVHPNFLGDENLEWSKDFLNITHIRTGYAVLSNLAESEIQEALELLNDGKINWSFDDPNDIGKKSKKRALKIRKMFE